MPYLLNLIYLLLLLLAAPWLAAAAIRKGKYREGYAEKFLGHVPIRGGSQPCVWLHAVSVGEVNLLRPLVAQLIERRPDIECVVSTTTATGYALAKTRYPELTVFYCPLDFSWAVRNAMQRIRPDLLVLAELELWPNLIRTARRCGTRVIVVNGRMGEKSFRGYRKIRPLMTRLLPQIDCIAAQDTRIADRFATLGMPQSKTTVTGSLKYDGAEMSRENRATLHLRTLAHFDPSDRILLAGSTQAPEESLALSTFQTLRHDYPQLRLVLVPRHPDRFDEVARMLADAREPFVRRSQLDRRTSDPRPRILLVDVVGELTAWWGTAHIAYVGGSLSQRGGQNMIEPAAYGAAVAFGPNTWNFRDIVQAMLAADAAVVVRNGSQLTAFVRRCLAEPPFAQQLGQRAQRLVESQIGATERTVEIIESLLDAPPAGPIDLPRAA